MFKPYFTLRKAQIAIAKIPSRLKDSALQRHIVKLLDYNRYITMPEIYAKELIEGGYYVSASSHASTGFAPKDIWLSVNIKTALDDACTEKQRRIHAPRNLKK